MKNTEAFYKANTVERLCDLIDEYTEFRTSLSDDGKFMTLNCETPFNRDFSFDVETNDHDNVQRTIEDIQLWCRNFDIDEDVAMYVEAKENGREDIPAVVDLVTDSQSIAASLEVLDDWLNKVNNPEYNASTETPVVIKSYQQGLSEEERKAEHDHDCVQNAYNLVLEFLSDKDNTDDKGLLEEALGFLGEVLDD